MPRGPVLALVGACAGVLLLTGCGDDRPTSGEGAKSLVTAMTDARDQLQRGVDPLAAWHADEAGTKDVASGCDDGDARRTYMATLDVPDSQRPDAASHALQVVGQLGAAGWDAKVGERSGSTATLTATRSKRDGAGSSLTLVLTPVQGGWHYALSARTACLPTSE